LWNPQAEEVTKPAEVGGSTAYEWAEMIPE